MTQLTQALINKIRTHPHRTKLWLSIYQPKVMFAGQINDAALAFTKGTMEIAYDNVTDGSPGLVQSGMTMYVGTTQYASDRGRIRVRSTTGSVISVAENYDISWVNDAYFTIMDFYEINAIFPRIIQDPADATKTLWYKDYDIAYTDQNSINGAFPCMGSHFAGFLDDGACNVFYSSSGTSHVNGEELTYDWWFGGAATTGSSSDVPGYVTYNTPGHYTTRMIVTGASGSVDYSYRHISIYDRPDAGSNVPILAWTLDSLGGDRDSGEVVAEITIHQNVPESQVRDGSLVVIFAEDWYGTEKISIGGNQENRASIVYSGYIQDGSIKHNWRDKSISFSITSPTGIMKSAEGFSVSIEDIDDPVSRYNSNRDVYPSPWMLMKNMGVKKAIWHYLKWHSTVLMTTDFQFQAVDQLIQYFDADRTSLFDAIDTLMKGALKGTICSDMQGKIWAELDHYLVNPTSRDIFYLDNNDWIGDPTIELNMTHETSFVEGGGIAYTGYGGTSTPYLAGAPGTGPGYRGSVEKFQGLALTTQTQLNRIVGYYYSYINRDINIATFPMAGNYRIFDIAPADRYLMTIPAEQNPRGLLEYLDVFVNGLSWEYDPEHETFRVDATFIPIPSKIDGETIPVPPLPPTSGGDNGGGFSIPPFQIPPISIPPITVLGGGNARFVSANYGLVDSVDTYPNGNGIPVAGGSSGRIYSQVFFIADAGSYLFTPVVRPYLYESAPSLQFSISQNSIASANEDSSTPTYDIFLVSGGQTTGVTTTIPAFVSGFSFIVVTQQFVYVTALPGTFVSLACSISVDSGFGGITFCGWVINYV